MLVLSRKIGDIIRMTTPTGQTIDVQVMRFGPGSVRLGITADRSVQIDRLEVAVRKAEEQA